ncbi:Hsp20/alpha crystallin family protein [Henriciella aquimarina]|uniref:Hsp20/alpha crystallin family protein n=1 Tax=Henriciella aquimarina TaxID=545261 RepID=UPI000A0130E6|nr:Hsp20/alpha crystallin family protein [Henriciella aquimarina]
MRFGSLTPFNRRHFPARDKQGNLEPFRSLRMDFDQLWDEFFDMGRPLMPGGMDFSPSVDVSETGKEIVIKADLPGMDEKDVELELNGDMLTISGERSVEKEEGEGESHRVVERSYGRFERSMRLPFSPEDKDVETSFKKGVLKVNVKKPKELENKARKIAIKGE